MTEETTAPVAVAERPLRGWLSPQALLGIAGLLTFVLIPVHFNTVYGGLPAHPLFVHVPVILIPTVGAALNLLGGVTIARAALGLLARGCLYFVFLTGDLGARAVWRGRVQSASLSHRPQPQFGQS